MLTDRVKSQTRWTYVLLSVALVNAFALVQFFFVLGEFKPQFVIVPTLVGLTFGVLISRIVVLREQLTHKSELFQAIADQAQEITFLRDTSGKVIYISPAVEDLTGYAVEAFKKNERLFSGLIHHKDYLAWSKYQQTALRKHFSGKQSIEVRLNRQGGDLCWLRHYAKPVYDLDSKVIGLRSTYIDITREKDYERRIERLADYDPLTDLPNRRYLSRYIADLAKRAKENDEHFAVMFLDIARFKYVNDAHGHTLGDQMLVSIAQRLEAYSHDGVFTARFGGDKFVILVPQIAAIAEAELWVRRLIKTVQAPYDIGKHHITIGCSLGISIFPTDGHDMEELISSADASMHHAKVGGLDYRFADPSMTQHAGQSLALETDLREAISSEDIIPYYQPIIDLDTKKVVAIESLARWQRGLGGFVNPGTFIPLAEEMGRINELGDSMLKQGCIDLAKLHRIDPHLKIAMNISVHQFRRPKFAENITKIVHDAGLETEFIELELTESVFLEDIAAHQDRCRKLRDMGYTIVIDDFGTGYSSLSYLPRLPVDVLKVDAQFISHVHEDPGYKAVVESILELAQKLHINVVVEGVELDAQLDVLKDFPNLRIQGYRFSRPMELQNLNNYLVNHNRRFSA